MNRKIVADISLLLVAFVWGTTFVVVQNAIDTLPPHTFNGIRFTIASIALLFIILAKDKDIFKKINRKIILSGTIIGVFLFGGYASQTVGLLYTTASKAGFITGLSVVLVPIFSVIFLKQLPRWPTILGVFLAAIGLYFLTIFGETHFGFGDLLVFFCAIFFALQIVFTGKYAPNYNTLLLAWIQITIVAVLSLIFAATNEKLFSNFHIENVMATEVWIALLVTAIFATALAFLAQTVFQQYTTPTRVAIIFSMEPVFAAITSFVVLHERLTHTALIGGILIFLGMILAEIPSETIASLFKRPKHRNNLT